MSGSTVHSRPFYLAKKICVLCCTNKTIFPSDVKQHFCHLTLSMLRKNYSRRDFEIFFLFFPENKPSYFIQIVY